jgi:riboflavin biosynthesis pyrimidine reductase
VRHVSGANPLRVVLDPKSRAATQARVFHEAAAPTLHLVSDSRPPLPDDSTPLAPGELRRCVLPCGAEGFEPAAVLRWLREAGYRRVLVEGGGVTVSRFLQAGVLDRLHVMVAPMLIGSGRPGLVLPPIDTLNEAIRPASRCFACGVDTLFDLDLRASDLRV